MYSASNNEHSLVFISDTFLFQQYFNTFRLSATNVILPVGVGYNKVPIFLSDRMI